MAHDLPTNFTHEEAPSEPSSYQQFVDALSSEPDCGAQYRPQQTRAHARPGGPPRPVSGKPMLYAAVFPSSSTLVGGLSASENGPVPQSTGPPITLDVADKEQLYHDLRRRGWSHEYIEALMRRPPRLFRSQPRLEEDDTRSRYPPGLDAYSIEVNERQSHLYRREQDRTEAMLARRPGETDDEYHLRRAREVQKCNDDLQELDRKIRWLQGDRAESRR